MVKLWHFYLDLSSFWNRTDCWRMQSLHSSCYIFVLIPETLIVVFNLVKHYSETEIVNSLFKFV